MIIQKEEAVNALKKLATHDTARTPALRVLLTHSLLGEDKKNTSHYMKELVAMDDLSIRDQLLILQSRKFVDEANFESYVVDFLTLENNDPEDISMTLDFLLKNNMPEKASSWLDNLSDEALTNPIVVKKASQVYFITKDYEKLKKTLLDEDWATQEYGRFLLLALTSKVEADPIAFRKYWQQFPIGAGLMKRLRFSKNPTMKTLAMKKHLRCSSTTSQTRETPVEHLKSCLEGSNSTPMTKAVKTTMPFYPF
jgi:hypothetical protein